MSTFRPAFALLAAGAIALAGVAVAPAPAGACSCGRPGVIVRPSMLGGPAPLNAQVTVSWWEGSVEIDEASLVLQPVPGQKAQKKAEKQPQAKGKAKGKGKKPVAKDPPPPATVDVELRSLRAASLRTVVLVPRQALEPGTRYQVLAAAKPGDKPASVGEFVTGDALDQTAPTWNGVGKVTFVHAPAVCCNCSTGDPWAMIELKDAAAIKDDVSPAEAIVYGVWSGDGAFDATAPPLALVWGWSGKLYLGHKSICSPANFDFPAGVKRLALRVAPIDAAGNVGAPADVTIDLGKPRKKPPTD